MDRLGAPKGWLEGAPGADVFPKGWLYGVMMTLKASYSATSSAFQSMWGSYLAGWMDDQRLTGFQTALTMTMAGPTRWEIPTASTVALLCSWDLCLVGWMADQTPMIGPRAVTLASRIDLVPLRAG